MQTDDLVSRFRRFVSPQPSPHWFGIRQRMDLMRSALFQRQMASLYDWIEPPASTRSPQSIDVIRLAGRLQLGVVHEPTQAAWGRIAKLPSGRPAIIVRYHPTSPNGRFAVAHEIAHELVDRGMVKIDELGYNSAHYGVDPICDFIAGMILMPMDACIDKVSKIAFERPESRYGCLLELARSFCVSFRVLCVQLSILPRVRFFLRMDDVAALSGIERGQVVYPKMLSFTPDWVFAERYRWNVQHGRPAWIRQMAARSIEARMQTAVAGPVLTTVPSWQCDDGSCRCTPEPTMVIEPVPGRSDLVVTHVLSTSVPRQGETRRLA